MATTHLTEIDEERVALSHVFGCARAGEEFVFGGDTVTPVVLKAQETVLDSSAEATLRRLCEAEKRRGEPLRMEADFADDLEQILASHQPRDTSKWD